MKKRKKLLGKELSDFSFPKMISNNFMQFFIKINTNKKLRTLNEKNETDECEKDKCFQGLFYEEIKHVT